MIKMSLIALVIPSSNEDSKKIDEIELNIKDPLYKEQWYLKKHEIQKSSEPK